MVEVGTLEEGTAWVEGTALVEQAEIAQERRKLATIQVLTALDPIDWADSIERATVLGWHVVVRKGAHHVGDPVVYLEIDSLVPQGPEWAEFLKPPHRLRTKKLRGQISQGLVLSVDECLPEGLAKRLKDAETYPGFLETKLGLDVSRLLGVVKWESQAKGRCPDALGPFPHFVPKTDELRVQSYPGALDDLAGLAYVITQKLDGCSGTYWRLSDTEYGLASRNLTLKPTGDSFWHRVAVNLNIFDRLPPGFAVQGEIVGPQIKNNPLGLASQEFYVFSVWDIGKHCFLGHFELQRFCDQHGLPMVPVLYLGDSFDCSLHRLLEIARGQYASGRHQEGIVVRSVDERYSPALKGRLSFKVINNDYLLKGGGEQ